MTAGLLLLALVLDAAFGEPDWVWRRLPHPAVLMGRAVGRAEALWNTGAARKAKGVAVMAGLGALALALGAGVTALPGGAVLEVVVAAILLAQRSLADHVGRVAFGLRQSLADGRRAVAHIVGRDTASMDATAVARGAIESGAENFSDGVIAPAFWFLIGGLPGMLLYKITNTADSMIGYRTERYRDFGWAAACFDDVLNWIPARLSAALIALSMGRPDTANVILRDAPLHRSPNAGWPEAAMAASLGVAISGPRSYEGQMRDYPFVNPEGRHDLGAEDIEACVGALWRAWALACAGVVLLTII